MKRLPTMALVGLLLLAACAGVKARETVLMPAMAAAWSTVIAKHVDAVHAGASEAMATALESGDRYQVAAVDWSVLRQSALAGVQTRVSLGEIGPGVGMSLVETINQFDRNHSQLLAR